MSISVNDTGIGMAPPIVEALNQLKAVSSSKGTESEEGWGLGYRVIFDLIKLSNGNLTISSELGRGTEVKIELPS